MYLWFTSQHFQRRCGFDSILVQLNLIQFNSIQFNSIQLNSIQFWSIQFNSINSRFPWAGCIISLRCGRINCLMNSNFHIYTDFGFWIFLHTECSHSVYREIELALFFLCVYVHRNKNVRFAKSICFSAQFRDEIRNFNANIMEIDTIYTRNLYNLYH